MCVIITNLVSLPILFMICFIMHDLNLIHTDLKPENILLVSPEYVKIPDYKNPCSSLFLVKVPDYTGTLRSPKDSYFRRLPKSSAIKVIDFGSTTYERPDQNYIVSTRHYRAPEVILGMYFSSCIDALEYGRMMDVIVDLDGVMLVIYGVLYVQKIDYLVFIRKFQSGEALFQTHENLEHLAMMERVLGPLPQHMLKRVDRHAEKYVRRGRLDWPDGATSRDSIKAVLKLPRLQNLIMQHVDHSAGDLIHLLQGLLRYDPIDRLTAREALRHPFFSRDQFRRLSLAGIGWPGMNEYLRK
ncbi:serine/threonine-protein kinase AFC2-like isoform X1 [Gossypium australe]|uniref:Serine/threonine-protein kinase AFC2-like isoform X1 n=1 Tax=Gossypium australe TaxID=47621 RepID=A0A5B6UJ48_9ROSI|nr:serine/threonine-protein kinase AFC2-like isoform X1 [Gossypium australe]